MFNKKYVVKIKEFLENDYAHNPDLGEKIALYIIENNKDFKDVILNFEDVKTTNTAFCNALLYRLCDNDYLKNNNIKLSLSKYNDIIYQTFEKVIANVKDKKYDFK